MIKFAFGVIFLLALFLLAFYLRRHRRISNLILLFATCIGLLFTIESIYRAFIRKPSVHTISYLPMVKDSILGLRIERAGVFPALNIDEYGDTVFNVKYTVIDDTLMNRPGSPIRTGFRNEQRQNEVVFIGCSFTFGIGLNDHETLPFQFGTLTQISSVNRGVGSYGIHQVYESFRLKYGNKDNHRRVFVYSLLPDHFIRATGIYEWNNYGPYFSIEDDKLINAGVKDILHEKKEKDDRGFILKRLTFLKPYLNTAERRRELKKLSPKNLEPGILMLKEIGRMVRNTGGKLVVLYWDDKKFEAQGIKVMGPNELYDQFIGSLHSNQVYVKRLSELIDFDDAENFIEGDGHPGAAANRKIAKFLAGLVADEKKLLK